MWNRSLHILTIFVASNMEKISRDTIYRNVIRNTTLIAANGKEKRLNYETWLEINTSNEGHIVACLFFI